MRGGVIRLPRHIKIAIALIGALAVANLVLYLTSAGAAGPLTFKGKTAWQWHARAVKAEKSLSRHGQMLRDEMRAHRLSVDMLTQKLAQVRLTLRNHLGPYKTRPPHYAEWMCIHRGEGAWNDPNAPYYGGLQMDMQFQRTYGWDLLMTKGTADNWTPLEQMWVAEKAYASGRGFYPWPTTARACGYIS